MHITSPADPHHNPTKHRWFVFTIFFFFMLLHQSDKLLIAPLTTDIMKEFNINEAQMGMVTSGAIIVGAIFYPVWGYLYDRYARAKLLALASFIWGCTTWISAIARTYPTFIGSRASTGIDDSSYPGLYSLLSDYFPPQTRGKVYGFLQITAPLGYLTGMVLALILGGLIGWRSVFYITGSLGIVLAIFIFFGVKEAPRGGSEPELENIEQKIQYKFNWKTAGDLFKRKSWLLLLTQGFFGVFPWQVITFWFFHYLETERGFDATQQLITMGIAILFLAAGYPIGGMLGDYFFQRNPRGRIYVAASGVIIGAILLWITMSIPDDNFVLFTVMLCLSAIFIPFASPNVISTVYDITLPEVRSTANAIQYFVEQGGSAVAPTLAGFIAVSSSMKDSILIICTAAWILCFIFFLFVMKLLPKDLELLRSRMHERAELEKQLV